MRLGAVGRSRVGAITSTMPAIFVVVALLTLLVVPLLFQQYLESLREEVDANAEPSRTLVGQLEFLLARQNAAVWGYTATGQPEHLADYAEAARLEREIYPSLEQFSRELSAEVLAEVVQLRTLSEQWHVRLAATGLPADLTDGVETYSRLEQELYLRTLLAANRTDVMLTAAAARRRQHIRELEQLADSAHVLLVLVALGAAISVLMLNAHVRRLRAESDARRADVEHALNETARLMETRADLIRGFTHDVKNPLGIADGYAELLQIGLKGSLNPQQDDAVGRIRAAIRGAIEITDDLLDLSRLESGGLQLRREATSVAAITRALVDGYTRKVTNAGLEISAATVPAHDPLVAYTDPDRVRQILENLISNALKFTPAPGRIRLIAGFDGPTPPPREGAWIAVSVADSGPGIPAEELDRIFDEFHRVPGSLAQGHGLGLAISRRLARLLGGDVTVRSTLGEGAVFTLWIPIRGGEATA